MTALSRVTFSLVSLVAFGAAAQTADAPARPAPAASVPLAALPASSASTSSTTVRLDLPAADQPREPVVQRTVIDDGRAVIEELRVRGQLVTTIAAVLAIRSAMQRSTSSRSGAGSAGRG